MSRPRKYDPGEPLTIDALAGEIKAGRYVWCRRPVHPGWAGSWQLNMALALCRSGTLRSAVIRKEWLDYQAKRLIRGISE